MRRTLLTVLLCLAATAAGALPAGAVGTDTGLGIRLLDAPTDRHDDPRARVYIVDHVAPGATISRRIEVNNDNPIAHHVLLYPDAATIAGDEFQPDGGSTQSELTTWTTVSPASLDLPARGHSEARITITVPKDAAPGERYGAVFAEVPADASKGIDLASRVGIRIYLSVGSGGEPASDFAIKSLTASRNAQGVPVVTASVHNTGGRALDMSGTLNLTDGPGSLRAGPFIATLGSTLAPGQTEPVTVQLDKSIPAGPWKAHLTLMSGLLKRAATATITFPTAAGATARPVEATAVPLTKDRRLLLPVAGGMVVGLGALVFLVLWRRRRRDGEGTEAANSSGHV